jgi:hypothetical protein
MDRTVTVVNGHMVFEDKAIVRSLKQNLLNKFGPFLG